MRVIDLVPQIIQIGSKLGSRLNFKKKIAQLDFEPQLLYDFYLLTLLPDEYIKVNSDVEQYQNFILTSLKDTYINIINQEMIEYLEEIDEEEESAMKTRTGKEDIFQFITEASLQEIREEFAHLHPSIPGYAQLSELTQQLESATSPNQIIQIIDTINDTEHTGGTFFSSFPWFQQMLDFKAQATPQQLLPFASSDNRKIMQEYFRVYGKTGKVAALAIPIRESLDYPHSWSKKKKKKKDKEIVTEKEKKILQMDSNKLNLKKKAQEEEFKEEVPQEAPEEMDSGNAIEFYADIPTYMKEVGFPEDFKITDGYDFGASEGDAFSPALTIVDEISPGLEGATQHQIDTTIIADLDKPIQLSPKPFISLKDVRPI